MKLFEMLDITKEHCNFLYPEDTYIKNSELEEYNTTKSYDIALEYETALFGLLSEDRKDVIKSFNNLSIFLVYVDILTWNYNSFGLTLAEYYYDKDLMLYNLEMYKLFEFFKDSYLKFANQISENPSILKDGVEKKLIEPAHIQSFTLFPKMAKICENKVKIIPITQSIKAQKARLTLWNNNCVEINEDYKKSITQIPLETWNNTGIYAEDLIKMGYSKNDVIGKFPSESNLDE